MQRVLVLGRGGAGKSTFARRLSEVTAIPSHEPDGLFWSSGLEPLPPRDWAELQRALVRSDRWILDGDLGPYDVLEVRLQHADTVVVLDHSFARCAWRAVRRGREAADFWRWTVLYRRRSVPLLRAALRAHAPGADVHWLTSPRQVRRLLADVRRTQRPHGPTDPDAPAR